MLGFGVFKVTDKAECKQAVLNAIRTGYRLIDTAAVYDNEDAVGEAARSHRRRSVYPRGAVYYLQTVGPGHGQHRDGESRDCRVIKKIGPEYFDLYLLHQAMGDYFSARRALEEAYEAGKRSASPIFTPMC
ncbi:aldo/keto reductase [Klebsiella pneumoniae]|uniref:Aldo/keto reductase n=1 Tax=Klebsiella pneumoniae TaxID=573 RepID=A0A939NP70_KLEPN|nr:aldo/keto reductase [Klebsiella pneumoniae]